MESINIKRKLPLCVLVLMLGLILIISGCNRKTLEVSISDVYYLRNNYIDEGLVFDIYIAEITLENSSEEMQNFINKHVDDAQGRTYKANFTYLESWGQSCSSTCSSDAKYIDAITVKPGYFEVIGEIPLDATDLKAYVETDSELLVFSLPDPGDLPIKEIIVHSEE